MSDIDDIVREVRDALAERSTATFSLSEIVRAIGDAATGMTHGDLREHTQNWRDELVSRAVAQLSTARTA